MRNLRERLMAVASAKPQTSKTELCQEHDPFFCREHIVPPEELCGFEDTAFEEICASDPSFSGKKWDVNSVVFLDTETTGLSGGAGTVAFEIGVGFLEKRGFIIKQYVMRDYHEEAAMLSEIASLLRRFDTIVTFNGKSFDLPLLESRMLLNRIRMPLTQMPHFDLLHVMRRVYKLRLKRCNLSALEEAVLGYRRKDDLPGSQVPQRYFDYIKTREFALLEDVLRHNFVDVKSLAALTGHICGVFRSPQMLENPQDLFGVGCTLMKSGRKQRARNCFKILGHSTLSAQAHMHLAASYKRDKDWQEVISSCQNMIASGEGGIWPYIELAKYYEHIEHDIDRAMSFSIAALRYTLNMMPVLRDSEIQLQQVQRRIERLKRKQTKSTNMNDGRKQR